MQAEPAEHLHKVTVLMDVNAKQVGQLCRDWRAIVDVVEVRPGAHIKELWEHAHLGIPHPPESVVASAENARSATAKGQFSNVILSVPSCGAREECHSTRTNIELQRLEEWDSINRL